MFRLAQKILTEREPITIALIGVGGTGSDVALNLVHLHEGLRALGFAGVDVVAYDPDVVSEANVVRQRYSRADIGQSKAETLVHRINMACGLSWRAVPDRFKSRDGKNDWDVVISCVDTRKARKQIHGYAFSSGFHGWKFWLDTGNDVTTGQVVLGTPSAAKRELLHVLPCATELHPELMDTSVPDDDAPSCSALAAIKKQDLMINKMVAVHAVQMLWQLFRDGEIDHHARYFDLRSGTTSTKPVPKARPRVKRGKQKGRLA